MEVEVTTIRTSMLGLLLATATLFAGGAIARAEDQITIGAIVPSSGPFAEWGRANTTTLNLLEKQVNEAGGISGKKL
jgi:branched-chain amino acid transport system substrate-binding protein